MRLTSSPAKEREFNKNTLSTLLELGASGPAGNRWFKVNLHAHGQGQSAHEIIRHARLAGIDLLAITDHQCFNYCDGIIAAAKSDGRAITVLPGIEITSSEGAHLLALFSKSFDESRRAKFLGWLELSGTGDCRQASRKPVKDILPKVNEEGGIIIVPHPYTPGIGLLDSARKISTKMEWLESGYIHLMQIAEDKIRFVDRDEHGNWVNRYVLVSSRPVDVAQTRYCLAPFNRSDAKTPEEIGQGCSWFRMAAPSIDGLRQVACEPHTRIARVEPPRDGHACILGVRVSGGFCDGQFFRFNSGLNCIIGQNYAGKSSLLDFVGYGTGHDRQLTADAKLKMYRRLSAILGAGGVVEVFLRMAGRLYAVRREFNPVYAGVGIDQDIKVADEPASYVLNEDGPQLQPVEEFVFPIEMYEQGRIHRLRDDVGRQLRMLDEFAGTRPLIDRRAALVRDLTTSATRAAPLVEEADRLSAEVALLAPLAEELNDKARLVPGEEEQKWANSIAVVEAIEAAIAEMLESVAALPEPSVEQVEKKTDLEKLFGQNSFLVEPDTLQEPALIGEWNDLLERTVQEVSGARAQINTAVSLLARQSAALRQKWRQLKDTHDRVITSQLAKVGVQSPQEVIQRVNLLRRQIQAIQQTKQPRLLSVKKQLDQLFHDRDALLTRLEETDRQISDLRRRKAEELTGSLDGAIQVSLSSARDTSEYLKVLDRLTTSVSSRDRKIQSRDSQLSQVVENISPIALARALRTAGCVNEGDVAVTLQDCCGITRNTQDVLCLIAADVRLLNQIETVVVDDVPEILVRRRGESAYADLSKGLSPGEQSAAILTLALQNRGMPLILDQPEDELGYSYVVHLIVPKLLSAKAERQLIMVTHNANIPVLGDADHVTQMENLPQPDGGRKCVVAAAGTFEIPAITEALVELEGGPQAFQFRHHRYSLQPLPPGMVPLVGSVS